MNLILAIEILIIVAALVMAGYHSWLLNDASQKYSIATLVMLIIALVIVLSWVVYGLPFMKVV